jgi:hypothetical protein
MHATHKTGYITLYAVFFMDRNKHRMLNTTQIRCCEIDYCRPTEHTDFEIEAELSPLRTSLIHITVGRYRVPISFPKKPSQLIFPRKEHSKD